MVAISFSTSLFPNSLTGTLMGATTTSSQEFDALTSEQVTEDQNVSCPICLGELIGEASVMPCAHRFHPCCLRPWLQQHSRSCPVCRLPLPATTASGEPSHSANASTSEHAQGAERLAALVRGGAASTLAMLRDVRQLRTEHSQRQLQEVLIDEAFRLLECEAAVPSEMRLPTLATDGTGYRSAAAQIRR
uniref:RING-type domain-containing protein n=1 Tax=Coccolithus braarudii TaxID=221442 RepID=A0A7S0PUW0_9EUKA